MGKRSYSKLFFNGVEKECSGCFQRKPVSEFGKQGNKTKNAPEKDQASYYRSQCKKCRSTTVWNKQLEKKISLSPEKYWDCDSCDKTIHVKHESCTSCGSNRREGE